MSHLTHETHLTQMTHVIHVKIQTFRNLDLCFPAFSTFSLFTLYDDNNIVATDLVLLQISGRNKNEPTSLHPTYIPLLYTPPHSIMICLLYHHKFGTKKPDHVDLDYIHCAFSS